MANKTIPTIQTNEGNVGIGVTSPRALLDLAKANNVGQVLLLGEVGANVRVGFGLHPSNAGMRIFSLNHITDGGIEFGGISSSDGSTWTRNHRLGLAGGNSFFNEQGGNVGIGTNNPSAKLEVAGSLRVTGVGQIGPAGGYGIALFNDQTNVFAGQIYGRANGLQFTDILGNASVYIASGGNVGIGLTNPVAVLNVKTSTVANREVFMGDSTAVAGVFRARLDDNSLTFISLENRDTNSTTDHGVGIRFNLGTSASSNAINAGGIYLGKTQQWTATASTQDSYLILNTALDGTASEKVRIQPDGSVGIGITNPGAKLQVYASAASNNAKLFMAGDNANSLSYVPSTTAGGWNSASVLGGSALFNSLGSTWLVGTHNGPAMRFGTNNISLTNPLGGIDLYVGSGANIGISNTNPKFALHVNGDVTIPNARYLNFNPGELQGTAMNRAIVASYSDDTATAQPKQLGIILHNDSNTNDTFSPALVFGSKSNSSNYSQATAVIAGRRRSLVGDANWHAGELWFWTATSNDAGGLIGVGIPTATPAMVINSTRFVGIGVSSPGDKLQVNLNSGENILANIAANGVSANNKVAFKLSELGAALGEFSAVRDGTSYQVKLQTLNNQPLSFGISGVTNMVLSTAGNLGIGTTSPIGKLTVQGNIEVNYNSIIADASVRRSFLTAHATINRGSNISFGLLDGASGPAGMTVYNVAAAAGAFNSQFITFNTHEGGVNEGERMRITQLGNVGIGTFNPTALLQVNGDQLIYANVAGAVNSNKLIFGSFANSNAAAIYSQTTSATAGDLILASVISSTITERVRIQSNGYLGIGLSPSTLLSVGGAGSTSAASGLTFGGDAQANLYRAGEDTIKTDGSLNVAGLIYNGNSAYYSSLSKTTTANWGQYTVVLGNASYSSNLIHVSVNGGNLVWAGTFLASCHLSYRPNETWINVKLLECATYNCGNDDVNLLALSNSTTSQYGVPSLVLKTNGAINGGYGTGYANNITVTVNGPSPNEFVLSSSSWTQPYTYQIATSANTKQIFTNESGNVGIGIVPQTNQANYKFLQVNGTNSAVIETMVGGTRIGGFDSTASALYVGTIGSFPLIFRTAVDEKMRIAAGGNVGIGTTNPTQLLESYKSTNAVTFNYLASNLNNNSPVATYAFDVTNGSTETRSTKAGIGYERHLTNGRGTLHIYNRATDDAVNFGGTRSSPTDIKVSIANDGNVGISSTVPGAKLDVVGTARISANILSHKTASYTTSYPGINSFGADATDSNITYYDTGKTVDNTSFRGVVWTGKHYIFTDYLNYRAYFYDNNFNLIKNAYGFTYVNLPIPSGYNYPHGAAWDGRYLWTICYTGSNSKIVGYDLDTASQTATIIAESAALSVPFTYDIEYADGHLYLVNAGTLYVYKWNGSTIDLVTSYAGVAGSIDAQAITYDGSYLWITQNATSVYRVGLGGGSLATISANFPPNTCGWAWNGSNIVSFDFSARNIFIINTTRLRIDTQNLALMGGRVGIGSTAPTALLNVRASVPAGIGSTPAGTNVLLDSNTSNYITFRNSSDNGTYAGLLFLDNNIGGYIAFGNAGAAAASDSMIYGAYQDHIFQNNYVNETLYNRTETMRIKQNGRVGIGTNAPTTLLSVGGVGSTSAASGITFGGDASANLYRDSSARIRTDGAFITSAYIFAGTYLQTSNGNIYPGGYGISSLVLNVGNSAATNWETYPFTMTRGAYVGIGTNTPSGKLHVVSSVAGETVIRADGTNGTLFSVVDDLSDSLMSVNNSAGLPVLEVFADDRIVMGQYGSGDLVVRNNKVGIGTANPAFKLDVSGSFGINAGTNDGNWPFVVVDPNTAGSANRYALNKIGAMGFNNANNYAQLQLVGSNGAYIDFCNAAIDDLDARIIYYSNDRFDFVYGTTMTVKGNGVGIDTTNPAYKLDVAGTARAERYRGINSLVLNTYATVNPASNVFLYSQENDRDSWLYLDSVDTASNWGIYHRQIDTTVSNLPGNSIGFIGGGTNTLQSYISLANGAAYFAGSVGIGTPSPAYKLDVRGHVVSDLNSNSVAGGFFLGNPSHGIRRDAGSNDVRLHTNGGDLIFGAAGSGSQQVTLKNGGNVGIGSATPGTKLDVAGNINIDGSSFHRVANDSIIAAPSDHGLVAYYGFDEGSSLLISDKTGRNNTFAAGTLTFTTTAIRGTALDGFGSDSNYVVVPDSTDFDFGTGDFAVSLWCRPNGSFTGVNNTLIEIGLYTAGILIRPQANTNTIEVYIQSSLITQPTIVWTANVWYHIVVTRISSVLNVYSNGTRISSVANTSNIQVASAGYIGRSAHSVGQFFYGIIDEVKIYKGKGLDYGEVRGQYLSRGDSTLIAPIFSTTNGNVGIGASTPAYKLDVRGQTFIYNGANNALLIQTTVADGNTRDGIYLYENDGAASGRQAISWYNGNQSYYKARLWTEVGSSYAATTFGIDVADDARTVATRLAIRNGNVGIGTTTPVGKLDVYGDVNGDHISFVRNANAGSNAITAIVFRRNGGNNGLVMFTNSSARTNDGGAGNSTIRTDNGKLLLGSNGTTYHALETDGNVGIGLTNPVAARLHIKGDGSNPVLRVESALLQGAAGGTAGKTFVGWMPIQTGALSPADTVYIPLFK